jgi:hypothetical protein
LFPNTATAKVYLSQIRIEVGNSQDAARVMIELVFAKEDAEVRR